MPIIDIEFVGEVSGELAQPLADAVAQAVPAPTSRTWVRLRHLPRTHYAEGGGGPLEPEVQPVFVSILKADLQTDELKGVAARVAAAVAAVCERPVENVHILFEAPARGRIAFGGELVV